MFDLRAYLLGLGVLLSVATATWAVSVAKRDVGIVDVTWGPMFALATAAYAWPFDATTTRGAIVVSLVIAWAARLALHIALRNLGAGEDYRYREIRSRNEPNFAFKSLYLVFWLQAGLAWLISLPLLAAQRSALPLGPLDALGIALVLGGLTYEGFADAQLRRFKRDPASRSRVLDTGLWRYSRHPNYFGECCVWWGFGCIGLAADAWWSLASPLLMTWLLLRVSGVALLERTIGERRPGYADYVRRTSAFLPLPPRKPAGHRAGVELET